MARNLYDEVRHNKLRTWFIVFFFIVLIAALGTIIGYFWGNIYVGLFMAIMFGMVYTLIVFSSGDNMIHATTHARPVTKSEYPHLYHTVEGLAIAAGIPTPKCYIIEDSALNAYATGKDPEHASIAVTTGLLKVMNRQELEGVIAHEMSHIRNYDIRIMMIAAVMVGVVTLLSDILLRSFLWGGARNRDKDDNLGIVLIVLGIVLAILAPFIAYLIRLAISRRREYLADSNGALLTRYAPGLASALRKIQKDPDPLVDHANRATAHLFIATPFRNSKGFFTNLFSTHPPIEERIRRLESMG